MHITHLTHSTCSANGSDYYISSHLISKAGSAFVGSLSFFPSGSTQVCARLPRNHGKYITEECVYLTEALLIPRPLVAAAPLGLCSCPLWGAAESPGNTTPLSCPRDLFCPKFPPPSLPVLVSHLCPPTHSRAHICSHTQSHSHVVLYICTDAHDHRLATF